MKLSRNCLLISAFLLCYPFLSATALDGESTDQESPKGPPSVVTLFYKFPIKIDLRDANGEIPPNFVELWNYKQTLENGAYANYLREYAGNDANTDDTESPEYKQREATFKSNIWLAIHLSLMNIIHGVQPVYGINHLFSESPMTFQKRLGYKVPDEKIYRHYPVVGYTPSEKSYPEKLDWRDEGAVGVVKDQGQCGSCWVFGTVGAIESYHYLTESRTQPLLSLSEQQVGSCNGNLAICDGGYDARVYDFMIDNDMKLSLENNWPYTSGEGKNQPCTSVENKETSKVSIPTPDHYRVVNTGKDIDLIDALQGGPVAVAIDASGLQFYKNGIYDSSYCSKTELNHEVLLVGYDKTEDGIPYWIIKNSWGEGWGDNGYFLMIRSDSNEEDSEYNNMCGIATSGSRLGREASAQESAQ